MQENENQRVTVAPRVTKKGKVEVEKIEVYENNWDLRRVYRMMHFIAESDWLTNLLRHLSVFVISKSLIDKMSPNVAKWIVYEKMKEPRLVFCHSLLASISNPHEGARESKHSYENHFSDEADLKQRQKLSKLVTEKYGPTNQNENVELIPEDISGWVSNADL